ncbi:MAG TPA: TIR domain-containing protein, partial [Candidatus Brocadiales bacterium]|nr:TIR domain-containing protein [Candidatus Brocadiales bacterium]
NQKNNLLPRARQNVVFEFGLFVGKLTRNRVCCLYTGNVERPTDLEGLVYLQFKDSVNEIQLDIVKELRAAGYDVKI